MVRRWRSVVEFSRCAQPAFFRFSTHPRERRVGFSRRTDVPATRNAFFTMYRMQPRATDFARGTVGAAKNAFSERGGRFYDIPGKRTFPRLNLFNLRARDDAFPWLCFIRFNVSRVFCGGVPHSATRDARLRRPSPPACSHQAVLNTHTKISRPGTSPHVSYHPGQWRRTDNG